MTDAVTVTDEMVTVAADIISSSKLGEPFEDTARLALNAALATQPHAQRIAKLEAEVERLLGKLNNATGEVFEVCTERDQALAREEHLREALTPSPNTKATYMGEFRMGVRLRDPNSGEEDQRSVDVPWTTIKEIMAAIRGYAEQKA